MWLRQFRAQERFSTGFLGAKLLFTILDGTYKFLVTSDTVAPDGQTKGYAFGVSAKGGRRSQRYITLATAVLIGLRPVN